jgi:Sec-independent protein translocase protein TatA
MDSIFGIGLPEIVLILIIAGMVMGPERIVRSARALGRLTAQLQNISRSFLRQLTAELDSVDEDGQLKSTVDELNQLRRQVADLRKEMMTIASGTMTESTRAIKEIKQEAENSILPPELRSLAKHDQKQEEEPVFHPPTWDNAELNPPRPPPPSQNGQSSKSSPNGPAGKLPRRVDIPEDPEL